MRKLQANEIECRVATVKDKGISLLLYKTARVDRAILDETFGAFSWQNDFKVVDGKMYGGIGVHSSITNEWIWKWDCGTESNTEAEKGQASDCFKRAGFKWGIGIELYTAPFIWINGDGNKLKFEKYEVSDIGYSDLGEINKLKIINSKTKDVVYAMGKNESFSSISINTSNKVESLQKAPSIPSQNESLEEMIKKCSTEKELSDLYNNFKTQLVSNQRLLELVTAKGKSFKEVA